MGWAEQSSPGTLSLGRATGLKAEEHQKLPFHRAGAVADPTGIRFKPSLLVSAQPVAAGPQSYSRMDRCLQNPLNASLPASGHPNWQQTPKQDEREENVPLNCPSPRQIPSKAPEKDGARSLRRPCTGRITPTVARCRMGSPTYNMVGARGSAHAGEPVCCGTRHGSEWLGRKGAE